MLAIQAPQPWGALLLLRQSQTRRDPKVGAEQLTDEIRAVTLLAAMQQYDVIRQSACPVEEFADGGKRLGVGKMAVPAGDTSLQEQGSGAIGLHAGVVVALQRNAVEIAEVVEEGARDMAEIGGIADAVTETVDRETVRAEAVVSEVDRVASEAIEWRKRFDPEWPDERHEVGAAVDKVSHLFGVTIDRDVQAAEGRCPAEREVVAVEVGEAEGRDVGYRDAGAVEAFGQRAGADASVDEQDTGRRANDRRVSGRAAGKDAQF